MHCPFSPRELAHNSPVHPNPWHDTLCHHKPPYIFTQNNHHTYLQVVVRKGIKDPKVDKILKKRSQRGRKKKKIERNKEPWRPPKIKKKYKKVEIEKKEKKREGATLLSFIPHLCLRVAPVLQFVESFHVVLA